MAIEEVLETSINLQPESPFQKVLKVFIYIGGLIQLLLILNLITSSDKHLNPSQIVKQTNKKNSKLASKNKVKRRKHGDK